MKIKNLFSLLFLSISLAFVGCSSDDDEIQKTYSIEASPSSISVIAAGEKVVFDVISSDQPEIKTDGQNWYTVGSYVTVWHNGAYHTEVPVTVQANVASTRTAETRASIQSGSARTATFTAYCGDQFLTITLTQAAPDPITVIDHTMKMEIKDLPEISGTEADAKAFGLALGLGWNLGNQFDAWYIDNGVMYNEETSWGQPVCTAETFKAVKAAGFSSVRIPITWMGHVGEGPSYLIEESYLNRVAEVVGYAEAAGLKAIINIHHDGSDSAHWLNIKKAAASNSDNTTIKAELSAIWTQIAKKFSDKGKFLIFEPFNEIQDGGWGWGDNRNDGGKQYAVLNEWNQVFVDAVRTTGGQNADRYLAVAGYSADPSLTAENLVMPKDNVANRLIVSVHCYAPYNFTLGGTQDKFGHNSGAGGEADIKGNIDLIVMTYQSKGIPVYVGEYGCSQLGGSREKYRLYHLEYFTKYCRENSIPCFVWDNGSEGNGMEHHAYLNHGTGEYPSDEAKAAVEALVHGYYTNDPDYTLDWVYNSSPK